jgi:hypothetical protein
MLGAIGTMDWRTSADPENEVWARFPCLAVIKRGDATIEDVVEMLKVE